MRNEIKRKEKKTLHNKIKQELRWNKKKEKIYIIPFVISYLWNVFLQKVVELMKLYFCIISFWLRIRNAETKKYRGEQNKTRIKME
jgi:hypothetical protein